MRHIDLNNITLPDGWEDQITELNQELNTCNDHAERCACIDENEVWRDLFTQLSNLGYNKCWYSEARDTMSDRDIDHFRPKKEAKNLPGIPRRDEEGYWFLAFDVDNFRFSSVYSNQRRKDKFDKKKPTGGKGVFFPLFAGSHVAKSKARCADEEIMLLDPCDADDVNLLTFDSTGAAIPNSNALLEQRDEERVSTSVKLYNLDHTPLVDLRSQVWAKCQRFIDEIRAITADADIGNAGRNRIKFLKDEMRIMMRRTEEVSAVVIACCEQNGLAVIAENR
jgi:uncharacterized protein (TIGR02646 family)